MPISVLRVSQLNRYLHSLLDGDYRLREVFLRGEIANFAAYPSGHVYFSLREENASVRAVMFRGNAAQLRFSPENGMQVLARGTVSLYERDGTCQIIVSELMPYGAGERAIALAQLRKKLEGEGLLDPARHRALPQRPAVLGVATSQQGAVLHDIISVVERKAPDVRILLAPAAVQGDTAAKTLTDAIRRLNDDARSDIIILARGGGSAENLECFQDETLVRAVAASRIPIISAVGHETDTTLCDLAADCRAATPTAAAEIALGGIADLPDRLAERAAALHIAVEGDFARFREAAHDCEERFMSLSPQAMLENRREKLRDMRQSLNRIAADMLESKADMLARRAQSVEHLSPLGTLARGYSITQRNGAALCGVEGVKPSDTLETRLSDGYITSVVSAVTKENGHDV